MGRMSLLDPGAELRVKMLSPATLFSLGSPRLYTLHVSLVCDFGDMNHRNG